MVAARVEAEVAARRVEAIDHGLRHLLAGEKVQVLWLLAALVVRARPVQEHRLGTTEKNTTGYKSLWAKNPFQALVVRIRIPGVPPSRPIF